jgi:hypothetical protein
LAPQQQQQQQPDGAPASMAGGVAAGDLLEQDLGPYAQFRARRQQQLQEQQQQQQDAAMLVAAPAAAAVTPTSSGSTTSTSSSSSFGGPSGSSSVQLLPAVPAPTGEWSSRGPSDTPACRISPSNYIPRVGVHGLDNRQMDG